MSFKLHISKAYDCVEWDYLEYIMMVFGFPTSTINLIMQCVIMTSFSVLVNGVPKDLFILSNGLRQGDHLSPYLFLLCTEGLVNLLNWVMLNKSLMGIKVCRGASIINHLLFTDNSLIFYKTNTKASNALLNLLNEHAQASRQCINTYNTTMVFSKNVMRIKLRFLLGGL